MKSGLHVTILGEVWELSDIDKDGSLDIEEFCLAMYLLSKAREGEKLPASLPQNYVPPSHRVVYSKVQKVRKLQQTQIYNISPILLSLVYGLYYQSYY